jgi:hypothetical protein
MKFKFKVTSVCTSSEMIPAKFSTSWPELYVFDFYDEYAKEYDGFSDTVSQRAIDSLGFLKPPARDFFCGPREYTFKIKSFEHVWLDWDSS